MTDLTVKTDLANAMALDFERDLTRDGVPPEKIQAQLKRSRDRLTSAPVAILLCLDMSEMDSYPDEKRQYAERTMAMQSVAAAGLQVAEASAPRLTARAGPCPHGAADADVRGSRRP